MIRALFVAEDGPYVNRPGIDAWPKDRDARTAPGGLPAVEHPPCDKWGFGARATGKVGQDDGCFAAALAYCRANGGVIEHPRGSEAWRHFDLPIPEGRGWTVADRWGGRSCYVDQGAYGHKAKKPTWLYAILPVYPKLDWTRVWDRPTIGGEGFHSSAERARAKARVGGIQKREQVSEKERIHTPPAFADLLISLARSCIGWTPPPPRLEQASLIEAGVKP